MSPMDPETTKRHRKLAEREADSSGLDDVEGGQLFDSDLTEARLKALQDPRFQPLVVGLQERSLGRRMEAVTRFFASIDPVELSTMELPQHLSQLRSIYLMSKP